MVKTFNDDGSCTKKKRYYEKRKDHIHSIIRNYSSQSYILENFCYTDDNFTNLFEYKHNEYNIDGSYISKTVYTKPDKYGFLSMIEKYDKDGNWDETFYYTDDKFSNLSIHETFWNFIFVGILLELKIIKLINKLRNKKL